MDKVTSQACLRNQEPILGVLRQHLHGDEKVLEIGSGTGQHAVYFCQHLPKLQWQTSDLEHNHATIEQWINEATLSNVTKPIVLDVNQDVNAIGTFDIIYSANTCHILSWPEVKMLFQHAAANLKPNGQFIIYGPFNYHGHYTHDNNREFDNRLKQTNPAQGIRDLDAITEVALSNQLKLVDDVSMPANNRLLFWRKS